MDRFGDHALVCCGGGDRTRRHNLLRNMVFHAAASANLHPELEKPGLLPQRPIFGSLFEAARWTMTPALAHGAPLTSTSQGGGLAPQPLGISLSPVGYGWILSLILSGTPMLRSQDTRTSSAVIKIPKYSASNKVSPSSLWLWKLSAGAGVGWPGFFGLSLPRLQPWLTASSRPIAPVPSCSANGFR